VIAIARSRLEPAEEIRARLQAAQDHIDPQRLLAAPDCGLGFLGPTLTRDKLRALTAAAHSL
jgi:5-methyltetrahydropteroyltriglutamate--homocysteine methyltransferase